MTKQKTLRRVSVLVIAILIITMSLLCVTLAKYKTEIDANYSGTAYSWSITANDQTEDFNVSLTGEAYPGMTEKSYTINVKNEGEVDALLAATITLGENNPENIEIALDKTYTAEKIAVGETVTVTVTVNWDFGENVDDTPDQGKAVEFSINLVAEQDPAFAG